MLFLKLAIENHWVSDAKREQAPDHIAIRPAGFMLYSPARGATALLFDGG